jgi:hypothetical protein
MEIKMTNQEAYQEVQRLNWELMFLQQCGKYTPRLLEVISGITRHYDAAREFKAGQYDMMLDLLNEIRFKSRN